jgi:hypothetical protein
VRWGSGSGRKAGLLQLELGRNRPTVKLEGPSFGDLLRELRHGSSHVDDFVFEVIAHAVTIRDAHRVLGGSDTDLRLKLLPLFAQEPVDENDRRILCAM